MRITCSFRYIAKLLIFSKYSGKLTEDTPRISVFSSRNKAVPTGSVLSQLLIMVCLWYTILTVELELLQLVSRIKSTFPTPWILTRSYELKGMVRCASHCFAEAVNYHAEWICIDDLCVSQKFHLNSGSLE